MKPLLSLLLVFCLLAVCHAELKILGEESPPGEYLDANGQPAGVTMDLVRTLLQHQGETATIPMSINVECQPDSTIL